MDNMDNIDNMDNMDNIDNMDNRDNIESCTEWFELQKELIHIINKEGDFYGYNPTTQFYHDQRDP